MPSANCGIYVYVYSLLLLYYFNFKILIETFDNSGIINFIVSQTAFSP